MKINFGISDQDIAFGFDNLANHLNERPEDTQEAIQQLMRCLHFCDEMWDCQGALKNLSDEVDPASATENELCMFAVRVFQAGYAAGLMSMRGGAK